jgi:hypothetical protein
VTQTFRINSHVRVARGFHGVNNFSELRQSAWQHRLLNFNSRNFVMMSHAQIVEAHPPQSGFSAIDLLEN